MNQIAKFLNEVRAAGMTDEGLLAEMELRFSEMHDQANDSTVVLAHLDKIEEVMHSGESAVVRLRKIIELIDGFLLKHRGRRS